MSSADRYGEIADNIRVATSTDYRNRDEREGRLLRALRAHVSNDGVDVQLAYYDAGADSCAIRVTKLGAEPGSDRIFLEESDDPVEMLDRALDRISREDWS
ncbi:hypothetical protein [Gordonia sihwensis]|uniref:hypothetical protein n=1 Tax=Gordonia sihwensis TaxID=173559 RepID=UPI002415D808|nr:hypothetical protein [Gordonia sihwensis]WFN94135.1 hypothetical protein P5P27_06205 [Gordonia sihwensis]WFN94196.1 hypothetical protein P5P27_06515 [Gordonia sihwensis]